MSTSPTSPRRALVAAAAGALAVAALASCGVPIDGSPRAINQTTVTSDVSTPTTIPRTGAQEVSVYFLNGERLERQGIPVEGDPTIGKALDHVLQAPVDGGDSDLRTAVPPRTQLRNVDVTDGVATIDLTGEINDISGPAQKEAFAQIVFTALSFDSIQKVRFLIDGEVVDAPTDDGNLALISAENYDKPLNPR
ncbi:GerMN domain-containing protein [Aquihabitans sp. McL0605]|uniref:GerMN domain-containing protein n=1 Tax=Aquihabitans sp. McL0605 TaxID=3415671 RepID=UPI003CE88777